MGKGEKKKAFGGYGVCFKGRKETMESIFGSEPIGPAQMTKMLWAFVKKNNLAAKA